MNYNSKPIIKEDKSLKVIYMTIVFPFENKQSDLANARALAHYLRSSNFESENSSLLISNCTKNNIISYDCDITTLGSNGFLKINVIFPNPKYINNMNINESIKYVLDCIFKPYKTGKYFDETIIEEVVEEIRNNLTKIDSNFDWYSYYRATRLLQGQRFDDYLFYHQNMLDDVNSKGLYEYYKRTISNPMRVFLCGDTDSIDMNIFKSENGEYDLDLFNLPSPREFTITDQYREGDQASTSIIFNVDDISAKDRAKFFAIYDILNKEKMIFKKLRTEQGLIYCYNRTSSFYDGIFTITPCTFNDGLKRCEDGVIEIVSSLGNPSVMNDNIDQVKKATTVEYLRNQNDKAKSYNCFVSEHLLDRSEEERINELNNIDAEELSDFARRLKPYSISRIRGDK